MLKVFSTREADLGESWPERRENLEIFSVPYRTSVFPKGLRVTVLSCAAIPGSKPPPITHNLGSLEFWKSSFLPQTPRGLTYTESQNRNISSLKPEPENSVGNVLANALFWWGRCGPKTRTLCPALSRCTYFPSHLQGQRQSTSPTPKPLFSLETGWNWSR